MEYNEVRKVKIQDENVIFEQKSPQNNLFLEKHFEHLFSISKSLVLLVSALVNIIQYVSLCKESNNYAFICISGQTNLCV